MDPITTSAIIGGAVNIAGQGLNWGATQSMNRKTREWNEAMYDRQYQDNLKLWNLQNLYNSPQAQRDRLINAGLNPALMFGGSAGGGIAAGDISAPKPNSWNPVAPNLEPNSFLNSIYSLSMQGAKTDFQRAKADMEQMQTLIWTEFFSDNVDKSLYKHSLRAQWSEAIANANIRQNQYDISYIESKNYKDLWDAKLANIVADSKLKNANSWYQEANKLLYEKTGLLLTDDFFYRNIVKDGVSATDTFIINLMSVLKLTGGMAPFKLF